MELTFWSKAKYLHIIQFLVCRFDGRFKGKPITFEGMPKDTGKAFVCLTFDDVQNANKFNRMHYVLMQPFF
jgi:hypothetical protein